MLPIIERRPLEEIRTKGVIGAVQEKIENIRTVGIIPSVRSRVEEMTMEIRERVEGARAGTRLTKEESGGSVPTTKKVRRGL